MTFDLCQTSQNISQKLKSARYRYCSSLIPINQYYDEIIDGVDILVLNTTYSSLPTGIFNLLLSCRLKDMNSSSPLDFLDYNNCTLTDTENGNYIVTLKISLDDIVNKKLCSFDKITTGETTIFLYTCRIAQWFFATEILPRESAVLLKKNSELKLSIDSKTMNKLYFSSNQVIDINDTYTFVRNVNTSSYICNSYCDGTDSGKSIILAGENITAQVKIDGALATSYLMSLLKVEFKFEDGTLSHIAGDDCSQLSPLDIAGQMQITCIVTISADNLYLETLIKLDPAGRVLVEDDDDVKVQLLRSIIGPYTICGEGDKECKKEMVNLLIEDDEKDEIKNKNTEDDNSTIYYICIAVLLFALLITFSIIYYYIKRSRSKNNLRSSEEHQSDGNPVEIEDVGIHIEIQSTNVGMGEMKEEIKDNGVMISMETKRVLKEDEDLPNEI